MTQKTIMEKVEQIQNLNIKISRRKLDRDFPLHTHDYYEIEFIFSGHALHKINGHTYEIKKGDIYLLSPSDFHELTIVEPLEYVNISFTEQGVSSALLYSLISDKKTIAYRLESEEYNKFLPIFHLISEENKDSKLHQDLFIQNLCECIIIVLLQNLNIHTSFSKSKDAFYNTILYINRNFRFEINLDALALQAGLSRNYYSAMFNKIFKMSVTEYINNIRLEYAKKLITTANMPITTACFNAGFGSFSTFSRAFKKRFGTSPTFYKN